MICTLLSSASRRRGAHCPTVKLSVVEPVDFSGSGSSALAPKGKKTGSGSSAPAPIRVKNGSGSY